MIFKFFFSMRRHVVENFTQIFYFFLGKQEQNVEEKFHEKIFRSASNISQSSNQSMASNNSEQTYGTAYTDDNESLFSGSLTPSIVVHSCNEGLEDEISSLPGRLRNLTNQCQEGDSNQEEVELSEEAIKNGSASNYGRIAQHPRMAKRHSDVRSLRSLKIISSARVNKQPLRRVRSDGVEHAFPTKDHMTSDDTSKRLLHPVEEHDADEIKRNAWLLPSPSHTPIAERRGKNAVSVFATLPRQKKKTVNEADCNKR